MRREKRRKIGRNDPCPCGSGKKFKFCHGGSGAPLPTESAQPVRLPWPLFSEEEAIGELLTADEQFSKFYEAERPKIKSRLLWARDTGLEEGIFGRHTSISGVGHVIRLPKIPVPIEDGENAAHEIAHAVIEEEGFPSTGVKDSRFGIISSSLNSAFHDPAVHARLANHGYDLIAGYRRELRQTEQLLGRHSHPRPEPSGRLDRLHWAFNFAGKVLDWELAFNRGELVEDDDFPKWFRGQYPSIAAQADRIVDLGKRIGFETPAEMTALLREIIRRYGLQDIVFM